MPIEEEPIAEEPEGNNSGVDEGVTTMTVTINDLPLDTYASNNSLFPFRK
jgi:hypothetical protein